VSDCDYVYLRGKRIARRVVVLRDDQGLEYVLPPHDDRDRTGLDEYGREYISAAEAGRRGLGVGIIVSDHEDGEPDVDSVAWDVCEFDAEAVYSHKGRRSAKKQSKNGTLFDDLKFSDDAQRDLILSRFLEGVSYGKPTKASIETVLGCLEGISREKIYDLLAFSNLDHASEGGQLGNALTALAGVADHPEYQERLEAYLQREPVLAYCMWHGLTAAPAPLRMQSDEEKSRAYNKRLQSLNKLEEILKRATEGGADIMSLATYCVEVQGWSTWTVAALGRAGVDPETWEDLSGFSEKIRRYHGTHVTEPFALMAQTGIPARLWEAIAFDAGRSRVPAVAVAVKMAELFPLDGESDRAGEPGHAAETRFPARIETIEPSVLTALSLLHATVNEVDEEYEHGEESATLSHLSTDRETYGIVTGEDPVPFGQMPGIDLVALLREPDPEQAALLAIGKALAAKESSEQLAHDADPTFWLPEVYPFESLGEFSRARELSAAETRAELSRFVEFDANGKPVRFLTREEQEAKKSVGYEDPEVYEYTDTDVASLREMVGILDTVSAVEQVLTNEDSPGGDDPPRGDGLSTRDTGSDRIVPDVPAEAIIAQLVKIRHETEEGYRDDVRETILEGYVDDPHSRVSDIDDPRGYDLEPLVYAETKLREAIMDPNSRWYAERSVVVETLWKSDPDELAKAVADEDPVIRALVAGARETRPADLTVLAQDEDELVRREVALNPSTSLSTLVAMGKRDGFVVRGGYELTGGAILFDGNENGPALEVDGDVVWYTDAGGARRELPQCTASDAGVAIGLDYGDIDEGTAGDRGGLFEGLRISPVGTTPVSAPWVAPKEPWVWFQDAHGDYYFMDDSGRKHHGSASVEDKYGEPCFYEPDGTRHYILDPEEFKGRPDLTEARLANENGEYLRGGGPVKLGSLSDRFASLRNTSWEYVDDAAGRYTGATVYDDRRRGGPCSGNDWLLNRAYDRAAAIPALCLAQAVPGIDDREIVSRVYDVPSSPASAKALVVALHKQQRDAMEKLADRESKSLDNLARLQTPIGRSSVLRLAMSSMPLSETEPATPTLDGYFWAMDWEIDRAHKAVTAARTEELQAALGREPEQGEISRAVADRYQETGHAAGTRFPARAAFLRSETAQAESTLLAADGNRRNAARVISHVNDRFGTGFFAETVAGLHDATPEELTIIVKEAETVETLRRVIVNPAATANVRQEAQARLDDWEEFDRTMGDAGNITFNPLVLTYGVSLVNEATDKAAKEGRTIADSDLPTILMPAKNLRAALDRSTAPEDLAKLADSEDVIVCRAVAKNSSTPPKALAKLANSKDAQTRFNVAMNPSTDPEVSEQLMDGEDI